MGFSSGSGGGLTPEQDALLTGAQQKSEKGNADGYLGIDSEGGVSVDGVVRSESNRFATLSHEMLTGGQDVTFLNFETGIYYSPVWSGISGNLDNVTDPTSPIWGEKVLGGEPHGADAAGSIPASWSDTATENATYNFFAVMSKEAYVGALTLEITSGSGQLVFKTKKSVTLTTSGSTRFAVFDYSSDGLLYRVRTGDVLVFTIKKGDGELLSVADSVGAPGKPYVLVDYRKFKDSAVIAVDPNGKIPAKYIPGGVQTVVEVPTITALPPVGALDTLYVALDTSIQYLWGGSGYVVVPIALALGENAQTAYRGDRGKAAYDHSQSTGNPHGTTISQISGLQTAIDGKQATVTGGASSVTSANLTASRAIASDASGKIVVSSATATELGYLSGATSPIQAQIDSMGMRKVGAYTITNNAKLFADNIFTNAFENYRVIIEWTMGAGASGGYNNFIRFRSAGVANSTANYGLAGAYSGPFTGTPSNNSQTSFTGIMNHTGATDCTCRAVIDIIYPQKPVVTTVSGIARYRYDNNSYYSVWWGGQFDATTVFDGLEVNAASGVFATAKMAVYAYT